MDETVYRFEVGLVPELNTIERSAPGSPVSLSPDREDDELAEARSPITVDEALDGGLVTIEQLCGTGQEIVKRSLESVFVGNVQPCTVTRVSFHPGTKWYMACVCASVPNGVSPESIVAGISESYGPSSLAGDTWMEGDIQVADGLGLGLGLVYVRDLDDCRTYVEQPVF